VLDDLPLLEAANINHGNRKGLPVGGRPINPVPPVPRPVIRAQTLSPSTTMSSMVRLKGEKVSRR
jgi:hypothetical protein